tara:strand:- start:3415 stop:3780 length:366 start_codon:yes stop_codon:yes gene_type:complete
VVHKQPTIQGYIIVGYFKFVASSLHISFPPDTIGNQPPRQILMSFFNGNKGKITPKPIKIGVLFVPLPPFSFQIIQCDPPKSTILWFLPRLRDAFASFDISSTCPSDHRLGHDSYGTNKPP